MTSSLLEIVDLGDGRVVLQRADSKAEPLVTIRFSVESQAFIEDNRLEVARAMIQAGLEAVASLSDRVTLGVETSGSVPPIIH